MQKNGPYLAKRTASIVPAELNRMQAARVLEISDAARFHDDGGCRGLAVRRQERPAPAARPDAGLTRPTTKPGMAPFELRTEARRSLIAVTLHGYWNMAAHSPAYADAIRVELRRLKLKGGCRHCLVDATGFAVQSIEITQALQDLNDSFLPDCPERIARLCRQQAERAPGPPRRWIRHSPRFSRRVRRRRRGCSPRRPERLSSRKIGHAPSRPCRVSLFEHSRFG